MKSSEPKDAVAPRSLGRRVLALCLASACVALMVLAGRKLLAEQARLRAPGSHEQPADTIRRLEAALRWDGGNAKARARLAGLLLETGRTDEAARASERAAACVSSAGFMLQCASVARRAGDENERIRLLETARLLQPDSPVALARLAAALYEMGKYDQAWQVASELDERDPGSLDAAFLMATASEAARRDELARFHYRRACGLARSGATSRLKIPARLIEDRLEKIAKRLDGHDTQDPG